MAISNVNPKLALGIACVVAMATHSPLINAEEASLNIKPARPISSMESAAALDATEKLLKYLATAREAMDKGDATEARVQLVQARSMLDRVRNQRPPAQVSYKLSKTDVSAVGYQDMVKSLPSGEESKLQKAVDALRKGDKQTASKNLGDVGTGIAFVEINYTVDDVDAYVTNAIQSLERGGSEDASKALRQARSSMEVSSGAMALNPGTKKK